MNTTEQERLLIVKINHLAERLEPYSDRPLAVHAAQLYQTADCQLHRGHAEAVADALATELAPLLDEAVSLPSQLFAALSELQISLPPAPAAPPVPEPVYYALPPAQAPPTPKPRPGIRQAAARIRGIITGCRRKEAPTAGAMQATAGLMACAPLPPRS